MAGKWITLSVPPLVGVKEVLVICGVQKMTFSRWRESGYFDVPSVQDVHGVDEPAQGPVWARADIEKWNADNGRQRAVAGAAAAEE